MNGNTFINNTAQEDGGAIQYQDSVRNINISGNTFLNNTAKRGGAIRYYSSVMNLNMTGNTFTDNNASYGGAIYYVNVTDTTMTSNTFTDNNATHNGGAIYYDNRVDSTTLSLNTFTNNNAEIGGAIYYFKPVNNITFTLNDFINNNATLKGGAIYIVDSASTINMNGNNFTDNTATDYGGAVFYGGTVSDVNMNANNFINNNATKRGGAIYYDGAVSNVNMNANTFTDNNATFNGGAIYYYSNDISNLKMSSNTFTNNTPITWNVTKNNGKYVLVLVNDDKYVPDTGNVVVYVDEAYSKTCLVVDGMVDDFEIPAGEHTFKLVYTGSDSEVFNKNTYFLESDIQLDINMTVSDTTVNKGDSATVFIVFNDTVNSGTIKVSNQTTQIWEINIPSNTNNLIVIIDSTYIHDETNTINITYEGNGYIIENKTATIKVKDYESIINDLNDTINELNQTVDTLNQTVEDQQATIDELNQTVEDQQAQIDELNQTVVDQQAQIDELNQTVDTLNQTVEDQQATIDELNQTVEDQQAQIDDLNQTIDDLNDIITEQNNTINELNDTIQAQEDTIDNLNNTVSKQEATIDELNDDIKNLEDTIEAQNDTINELNDTVQEQKDTITNLTQELDNLLEQISSRAIITVDTPDDSIPGEYVSIIGKLTDAISTPLTNKTVFVTVNGNTYNTTTDNTGVYNYASIYKSVGTKNITVTFNETGYNTTSADTSFKIKKLVINLTVDSFKGIVGENVTLRATITDEYGNPVTGGNIVFKLNGRTLRTDGRFDTNTSSPLKLNVTNGVVTYTLTADTYLRYGKNITAAYSGTSIYEESDSNTAEANIQLRYAETTLTVTPNSVKHYEYVTFTAKVKDTTNNTTNKTLINDGYVMFKVNGVTLKDANNTPIKAEVINGTATYKYYIEAGVYAADVNGTTRNYTLTAVHANPNYYPVNNNANSSYTVQKSNITINIQSATVKSTTLTVKANITDIKSNLVKGFNKVAVKINGATYKENDTVKYYSVTDGKIDITGIKVNPSNVNSVELVTGESKAYLSSRATTTDITKA